MWTIVPKDQSIDATIALRCFCNGSSKSWNNCNPISSEARNAASRRCGVPQCAASGFEEVDQYFWSTSSKPCTVAISNPTPSMDFVPHPSRCGVTIVPALRASVAETAQRYSCDHALDLWDSGPHHFATSPKRSFWMAWLVRNEELGIRSSIVSNLFAATQKRSFWMIIMVYYGLSDNLI